MTPLEMLDQLRKDWFVVIGTSVTDEPMVELYPKSGPDADEFHARYVEPKIEHAITRAYHGDASDG